MTYKIVRDFADPKRAKRTIETGLTLEEAQQHCRDPETDSATGAARLRYTARVGLWFDGYTEDP